MKALFVLAVIFGGEQYNLDTNLSLEECGVIVASGVESMTLEEGVVAVPEDATYQCQPQISASNFSPIDRKLP